MSSPLAGSVFSSLLPPDCVRGITKLTECEKALFKKKILVPCLRVSAKLAAAVIKLAPVRSLTVEKQSSKLRPAVDVPGSSNEKYILFDPEKINDETENVVINAVNKLVGETKKFQRFSFDVCYEDWNAKTCINAILPKGLVFSGFTQAGHIVHVNLREEMLPYKYVVGQILRDKISRCRTVVNKLGLVDNEFRTFQIDLLAGDPDYVTTVVSDGMKFKIDFSKTFWNTRLGTEHRRIWKQFNKNSLVFDCCTGVGPFVLPAARIPVLRVYANDLNPDCIAFLKENIKLNKLEKYSNFHISNMDAKEFIRNIFGTALRDLLMSGKGVDGSDVAKSVSNVHVLMNLPAKSLTFLQSFRGLLESGSMAVQVKVAEKLRMPILIHCHFFVKANEDVPDEWYSNKGISDIKSSIGTDGIIIENVHFVRKVAGRKWMLCISFQLPPSVLCNALDTINSTVENFAAENFVQSNDMADQNTCSVLVDNSRCNKETELDRKESLGVFDSNDVDHSSMNSEGLLKSPKRHLCEREQDDDGPKQKRNQAPNHPLNSA